MVLIQRSAYTCPWIFSERLDNAEYVWHTLIQGAWIQLHYSFNLWVWWSRRKGLSKNKQSCMNWRSCIILQLFFQQLSCRASWELQRKTKTSTVISIPFIFKFQKPQYSHYFSVFIDENFCLRTSGSGDNCKFLNEIKI